MHYYVMVVLMLFEQFEPTVGIALIDGTFKNILWWSIGIEDDSFFATLIVFV